MEENKILKKFEATDVTIEIVNGKPLFELYSAGMAIGYTKTAKGKLYPRTERIDRTIVNAGISAVVHDGQLFLTQNQLYDFMLEAHTEKCKPFRKWITDEVLPMIEGTGAYIESGREEEMVEKYFPNFSEDTKKNMIQDLLRQNAELKEFYHDLMETEGLMSINTMAKELNIGEYKLFAFLRRKKILFYDKDKVNVPYERFRKEGKFQVKETPCHDGNMRSVTYATKKGLDYVRKLLRKDGFYESVTQN